MARRAARRSRSYRAGGADAVVTASTGNHGAATRVGRGAHSGMRAVVFVPGEASEAKLALLEQLGAELRPVGRRPGRVEGRWPASTRSANELPFFEDGAEPAQFDGYEAIGEEILEQLGAPPGAVIVPVGNGALIIGVAARRGRRA